MELITRLKKIALRLPRPMKNILQKGWGRWCGSIRWDDAMTDSIADYFKISKKETKFLLRYGGKLDAFFWHYLKSHNGEHAFYATTPFYIFDLAFWHMTRYQRIFRCEIIKMSQGSILDFGGGVGDLSLALHRKGFMVTYADVKGETFNFAKYLFSRSNASITMIDLSRQNIQANYDTIICLDVIEHLENQKETIDSFIKHLNPGGFLMITNLYFNVMDQEQYENHPMHIPIAFDAKKYLLDSGLKETKYPWAFVNSQ